MGIRRAEWQDTPSLYEMVQRTGTATENLGVPLDRYREIMLLLAMLLATLALNARSAVTCSTPCSTMPRIFH